MDGPRFFDEIAAPACRWVVQPVVSPVRPENLSGWIDTDASRRPRPIAGVVEAEVSVGSALAERLRDPQGWPGGSGVEWWLLENGTVTPKASAGVSRDTSSSIPHGETPSGAVVQVAGTGQK